MLVSDRPDSLGGFLHCLYACNATTDPQLHLYLHGSPWPGLAHNYMKPHHPAFTFHLTAGSACGWHNYMYIFMHHMHSWQPEVLMPEVFKIHMLTIFGTLILSNTPLLGMEDGQGDMDR